MAWAIRHHPVSRPPLIKLAPDTVNTMPEAVLLAVADHGRPRGDTVRAGYAAAEAVMGELRRVGVDIADVADLLEAQGIELFAKSWDEPIASVTARLEEAGARVMPAGAVTPAKSDGGQDAAPAAGAPWRTAVGARV